MILLSKRYFLKKNLSGFAKKNIYAKRAGTISSSRMNVKFKISKMPIYPKKNLFSEDSIFPQEFGFPKVDLVRKVSDQMKEVIEPITTMQEKITDPLRNITEDIIEPIKTISDNIKGILNEIDFDKIDTEAIDFINDLMMFIDAYNNLGWSLSQDVLLEIYDKKLLEDSVSNEVLEEYIIKKINDKFFMGSLEKDIVSMLEKDKQSTFKDTLKLIDKGYYTQSAFHTFGIIEYLIREISKKEELMPPDQNYVPIPINLNDMASKIKESLDQDEDIDIVSLYNISSTYDKLLIKEMFSNHKGNPTGILLIRNELLHGKSDESKINQKDCYKMLMIILTLVERLKTY